MLLINGLKETAERRVNGMNDLVNKQLLDALEAMCELYVPEDESHENDAIAGYAMNILETAKKVEAEYKKKPLPEDDVWELIKDINPHDPMYPILFARAVERKHGIGA
jgi:hypothetical protein